MKRWHEIAAMPAAEQPAMIARTYEVLAGMVEAERQARIVEMETMLYRQPDEQIMAFNQARLRAMLDLRNEAADAVTMVNAKLIDLLPGPMAMKHVGSVQTVAREFTAEEQGRLTDLFPKELVVKGDMKTAAAAASGAPTPLVARQAGKSKPWWAFWKAG
jgi:hypothetical protein